MNKNILWGLFTEVSSHVFLEFVFMLINYEIVIDKLGNPSLVLLKLCLFCHQLSFTAFEGVTDFFLR